MYHLFKSELNYNRAAIVTIILLFAIVQISFLGWGLDEIDNSFPALRATMVSLIMILFIIFTIKSLREKRTRFNLLVPVSLFKLSLVRILFLPAIWLFILVLFYLSTLIVFPSFIISILNWDLVALSGFIFAANALVFVNQDLNNFSPGNFLKIFSRIIFLIVVASGYIIFLLLVVTVDRISLLQPLSQAKMDFMSFVHGPLSLLFFLVPGILMTVCGIYSFQKRKSYIE